MSTATEQHEQEQRRQVRQFKAFKAMRMIQERTGAVVPEHVMVASLSSIAEARSVWDFLVSKGLASARQREEFLDKAFDDLLALTESQASKIATPQGMNS